MIAALLIATGTTRKQDGFDPLKQVGGLSAVQRILLTFRRARVERIVLVADREASALEKHLAHLDVVFLYQDPQDGAQMLDAIKCGLTYLADQCEGVLIAPVDIPLFAVDTVRALMNARGPVAVPAYEGKSGHPVLVKTELFPGILRYRGEDGLQGAIRALGIEKEYIPVDDAGVRVDVQTQQDYGAALENNSLKQLHPELRLRIAREKVFFGPGPKLLLTLVAQTGSLRDACKQMGISYSKGWKLIAEIESQLGYPVIIRQQGGKTGGSSHITEKGEELLLRYNRFCAEADALVQQAFDKHFETFES